MSPVNEAARAREIMRIEMEEHRVQTQLEDIAAQQKSLDTRKGLLTAKLEDLAEQRAAVEATE